jgi:hypothetical protein
MACSRVKFACILNRFIIGLTYEAFDGHKTQCIVNIMMLRNVGHDIVTDQINARTVYMIVCSHYCNMFRHGNAKFKITAVEHISHVEFLHVVKSAATLCL